MILEQFLVFAKFKRRPVAAAGAPRVRLGRLEVLHISAGRFYKVWPPGGVIKLGVALKMHGL